MPQTVLLETTSEYLHMRNSQPWTATVKKLQAALAALIAANIGTCCLAAPIKSVAYQATYREVMTPPGTKQINKYSYDGKGMGRVDILRADGRKSVSIIDINKKTMKIVQDGKLIMEMPMQDSDFKMVPKDMSELKASAVTIGTKSIAGHSCLGFKYDLKNNIKEEIWLDEISGVRVYSKVITPTFTQTAELTEYRAGAPDPSVFNITK